MDETECIICFAHYDDKEHRPRSLTCGHTTCSACLEKAIKAPPTKCPKCRAPFSAGNVKDIPVNFALEGVMKLLNIYQNAKGNDLPDCLEHQLPVSHRCSTHKAWICQRCVTDDHSLVSCKVTTTSEELNLRKSTQLDKSLPLRNTFEESCKKSDDCREQIKKLIEEDNEEIIRLQKEIERKKTAKVQKEEKLVMFNQKQGMLKNKGSSYDEAVASLKSADTIKDVSRYSLEVQSQAEHLQLISKEIENEVDLMLLAAKVTTESSVELSLANHKLSASPPHNFQFPDESNPPMTDGILTFMDIAWPNQEPRRVYIKMLGNTARVRQHLLLITGHCGPSYIGLNFNNLVDQGKPGEYLISDTYDGGKAAPLLEDVTATDIVKHAAKAGLVAGAVFIADGGNKNKNNGIFGIYVSDEPGKGNKSGFGHVISGLEIVKDVAKSNNRLGIKIVSCGLVLERG
ncbi:unnamed protein product, partial [Meganyctiphanes norvegica]